MRNSGIVFEDKELQTLLPPFTLPSKKKIPPKVKRKKVIVIAGPTGVGKTQLSLIIAQALGGEIISADSMQVYRGMDIGTNKVSKEDRDRIPHHLIDSRDLDETFNVVEFYHEAIQSLNEIFSKGHVPIVVGGTGFYLHALLYGPPTGPASVPEIRSNLENEMKEKGSLSLYERLRSLDPDYAGTITQRDRHKIIRALEIMTITNQKVSQFSRTFQEMSEEYDFRCWFIYLPKEKLYQTIEARCEKMIVDGLLEEVRILQKQGLEKNRSASHAIGYRQCLDYLHSAQSKEDWEVFKTEFKKVSRRYAKRQYTWFKKEPLFRWLNIESITHEMAAEMIIQDFELSF